MNTRAHARPVTRTLGRLLTVAGSAFAYATLVRPWYLRWGATDAEVAADLPGDELVPDPVLVTTRAVTVHAPPEDIWPWLVQLGQGRGGFYSYTWIENLLGCDIHNANTIVPEWQQISPGDLVKLAPNPAMPPAYVISRVEPNRALVMGHHVGLSPNPASPWSDTWQFVLAPAGAGVTRLLLRARSGSDVPWINQLLEPGIFLIERRMLLGIKERAERAAASG